MSLGGIAIAIGAMVDAAIVMIENAQTPGALAPRRPQPARAATMIVACKEVGPALFFAADHHRVLPAVFRWRGGGTAVQPVGLTKTFAMAGAALLSVTLVPVLMMLFIRGDHAGAEEPGESFP